MGGQQICLAYLFSLCCAIILFSPCCAIILLSLCCAIILFSLCCVINFFFSLTIVYPAVRLSCFALTLLCHYPGTFAAVFGGSMEWFESIPVVRCQHSFASAATQPSISSAHLHM